MVFVRAIFAIALPIVSLIAFALVYIFPLIVDKDLAKYKRRIIVSMISIMFLMHPTITDLAFGLFNCYSIEGE